MPVNRAIWREGARGRARRKAHEGGRCRMVRGRRRGTIAEDELLEEGSTSWRDTVAEPWLEARFQREEAELTLSPNVRWTAERRRHVKGTRTASRALVIVFTEKSNFRVC